MLNTPPKRFFAGQLVWAKTKKGKWWPARIIKIISFINGTYLVNYIEKNKQWSELKNEDLKEFSSCFEIYCDQPSAKLQIAIYKAKMIHSSEKLMQNYQQEKVSFADTVKDVLLKKVSFQIEMPLIRKEPELSGDDSSHRQFSGDKFELSKLLKSKYLPDCKVDYVGLTQLQNFAAEVTISDTEAQLTMGNNQNQREFELNFDNSHILAETSKERKSLEEGDESDTQQLKTASISRDFDQEIQTKANSEESASTDDQALIKIEPESAISNKDRDLIMVNLADSIAQKSSASKLEIYAATYIIESAALKVFGIEEQRYKTAFRIIHYCIQENNFSWKALLKAVLEGYQSLQSTKKFFGLEPTERCEQFVKLLNSNANLYNKMLQEILTKIEQDLLRIATVLGV